MHLGRVSNESLVVIDLSTSGVSFVSELVQTSLFKKKQWKKIEITYTSTIFFLFYLQEYYSRTFLFLWILDSEISVSRNFRRIFNIDIDIYRYIYILYNIDWVRGPLPPCLVRAGKAILQGGGREGHSAGWAGGLRCWNSTVRLRQCYYGSVCPRGHDWRTINKQQRGQQQQGQQKQRWALLKMPSYSRIHFA